MGSRTHVRAVFAVAVVALLSPAVHGYVTTAVVTDGDDGAGYDRSADPRDGITVIATDSNSWLGREEDGPKANAELLAYAANGSLLYHDDSHTRYWDVDPVPGTAATVEYVASDHLPKDECGGGEVCTRNVVERVNLTTGDVTRVYARVTPGKHATRWHDVDRVGPSSLLVADIERDRAYVVNTTTGLVEWSWNAQSAFALDSGGPFPSDWTHLNDVERLPDGRVLVSLRNHDQVVFVDPQSGLDESWTLGGDGDHDVLYEQHNPDYVPAEAGGPALLVADSENNRLVEYRREDGSWIRTWTWQDRRLQWPRDADRLPNGHTLVTDSNGGRVLEVDEDGSVVWSVDVAFPYEAERLGTGDESEGGPAVDAGAGADGPATSTATASEGDGSGGNPFRGPVANAVAYVTPAWMNAGVAVTSAAACLALLAWGALELRWASVSVSLQRPIRVRRDR